MVWQIFANIRIITYTSITLWILPLFKQYRGRYFYYFLILAVFDPILLLLLNFFTAAQIMTEYKIVLQLLLFHSVVMAEAKRKKYYYSYPAVIIITLFLSYLFGEHNASLMFLDGLITLLFLRMFVLKIFRHKLFNIYFLMLFVYQFSLIINYLVDYLGFETGMTYFYFTVASQGLFALYFSFFGENDKLSNYSLKKYFPS